MARLEPENEIWMLHWSAARMVSMELVIHSTPLNCQMQSTRILLIGGVSEIWEIFVLIVANVPLVFVPGMSKETNLSGKFVAAN